MVDPSLQSSQQLDEELKATLVPCTIMESQNAAIPVQHDQMFNSNAVERPIGGSGGFLAKPPHEMAEQEKIPCHDQLLGTNNQEVEYLNTHRLDFPLDGKPPWSDSNRQGGTLPIANSSNLAAVNFGVQMPPAGLNAAAAYPHFNPMMQNQNNLPGISTLFDSHNHNLDTNIGIVEASRSQVPVSMARTENPKEVKQPNQSAGTSAEASPSTSQSVPCFERYELERVNGARSPFGEYHLDFVNEWDLSCFQSSSKLDPPTEKTQHFFGEYQCAGSKKPWQFDSASVNWSHGFAKAEEKFPGSYVVDGKRYNYKVQFHVDPRYWPINVSTIKEETFCWISEMCKIYSQWDIERTVNNAYLYKTNHPLIFVFMLFYAKANIQKGFIVFNGLNYLKTPIVIFKTKDGLYGKNMAEKLCKDEKWDPSRPFYEYLNDLHDATLNTQNLRQNLTFDKIPTKIKEEVVQKARIMMTKYFKKDEFEKIKKNLTKARTLMEDESGTLKKPNGGIDNIQVHVGGSANSNDSEFVDLPILTYEDLSELTPNQQMNPPSILNQMLQHQEPYIQPPQFPQQSMRAQNSNDFICQNPMMNQRPFAGGEPRQYNGQQTMPNQNGNYKYNSQHSSMGSNHFGLNPQGNYMNFSDSVGHYSNNQEMNYPQAQGWVPSEAVQRPQSLWGSSQPMSYQQSFYGQTSSAPPSIQHESQMRPMQDNQYPVQPYNQNQMLHQQHSMQLHQNGMVAERNRRDFYARQHMFMMMRQNESERMNDNNQQPKRTRKRKHPGQNMAPEILFPQSNMLLKQPPRQQMPQMMSAQSVLEQRMSWLEQGFMAHQRANLSVQEAPFAAQSQEERSHCDAQGRPMNYIPTPTEADSEYLSNSGNNSMQF